MARKTDKEYAMGELQKFANAYCKAAAMKAQELIVNKAKSLMEDYYNDCKPSQYVRTYNLHDNAISPLLETGDKIYKGGVMFSSEKMNEYSRLVPDRSSEKGIFGYTKSIEVLDEGEKEKVLEKFYSGSHYANTAVSKNAIDVMNEFLESKELADECRIAGLKYASSQNYKYIWKF